MVLLGVLAKPSISQSCVVCHRQDPRKTELWLPLSKYCNSVTYRPLTEPSIKRCTCVNKRKNIGSRWMLDNYITRCPRRFDPVGVSWRQDAELRANGWLGAKGPQWPTVEQHGQDKKEVMLCQKNLGQYVAVCPCLQLTSHTLPTSTLSRIKC